MQNLIPIQITLQAANAADVRQLVQDLAGTLSGMQPDQIPARTQVSAVDETPTQPAPVSPVPVAAPAPVPTAWSQASPAGAPVSAPQPLPTAAIPVSAPQPVPSTPAAAPAPAVVPTAAPAYTLDQLAVAATQLMDAGHDIIPLLRQFGVQALMELPKERYGEFATALRQMGARI